MWTTAVCLLALALVASASYSATPYGFSSEELAKLEAYAHRTANEKLFLGQRLEMLIAQKQDLFQKLNEFEDITIPGFQNTDQAQDNDLIEIKRRIEQKLFRLGDLEARVAGGAAVARRVESELPNIAARIEGLVISNIDQSATLTEAQTFLNDAKEKLEEKLQIATSSSDQDIDTVNDATSAFVDLLNTRKCVSDYVEVVINYETGEGSVEVPYPVGFDGRTPVVFCGLQGFTSKLKLGQSFGYGAYPDPRQVLAFATDCKAFTDKVLVTAFDQSRGAGNSVQSVIVQYKACSFAALA